MQNLQLQQNALNNLKSVMQIFCYELQKSMQVHTSKIRALQESGLPVQILENYLENYLSLTCNIIHQIENNIETIDLPYANRLIEAMDSILCMAGVSSTAFVSSSPKADAFRRSTENLHNEMTKEPTKKCAKCGEFETTNATFPLCPKCFSDIGRTERTR